MKRLMALVAGATLVVGALGSTEAVRADDESGQDGDPTSSLPTTVEPSATDGYIVVMKDKPLIDTIGQDQLGTPAADAPAAALEASHDDVVSEEGLPPEAKVGDYVNGINGFAVTASFEQAKQLATNSNVAAVLPDELQQLDSSGGSGGGDSSSGGGDPSGGPSTGVSGNDDLPKFLGLTRRGEAWKSGVTGEGVRIGVIDSGIWPEHPSFAGSTPDRRSAPRAGRGLVRLRLEHRTGGVPRRRLHVQQQARRRTPGDGELQGDVPARPRRVRLGARQRRPRHPRGLDGRRQRRRPGPAVRRRLREDLRDRAQCRDRRLQGGGSSAVR